MNSTDPQKLHITKGEPLLPLLSWGQAPHLHLEQRIATQAAPWLLLPEETQLPIQGRQRTKKQVIDLHCEGSGSVGAPEC